MEKKKYVPGKTVETAKEALETHRQQKPGSYQSQWKEPAEQILGKIQSRGPFTYNPSQDPLYRQAVDQHVRLGRKAMMDTVGKAAALTGGYGNSYAQGAGQQAYGEYLQALTEKLPQFEELAMKRHGLQGKDLMDQYQLLSQREKEAYSQYQKVLEQYFAQQDRLQGAYDREKDRDYQQYVDDRDQSYQEERDRLGDAAAAEQARRDQERWQKEMEYTAQQDQIKNDQWEKQFAENKRRFELQWAEDHQPSGGGGGGGGGSAPIHYTKYQNKNSMTEKKYEYAKKDAVNSGHYGSRPSGRPWSPSVRPSTRHNYRATLN